ncbi:unnamed protein product [Choristocarpus tenellus]
MGTPAHCMPHRTDNKMYKVRHSSPPAPLLNLSLV